MVAEIARPLPHQTPAGFARSGGARLAVLLLALLALLAVTLWVGGPFTTVALALGLDPEIATLAKELVLMGAGFNVDQGGNHRINGRREFNWWWDPEAARIAMSAPWKKITITPVDISVKTTLSDDLKKRLATSNSKAAQFIT